MPNKKLIIAGQFPPPINGFSYITQEITKLLEAHHECERIDLATHVPNNGLSYHLQRLHLAISGFLRILRYSRKPNSLLYIACDGGLGIFYICLLTLAGRLARVPIFIHHHNFQYIDTRKPLMDFLLCLLGPKATHIFLCSLMAQRFAACYGIKLKFLELSNSAFVQKSVFTPTLRQTNSTLTIGLLSNLNTEKGLDLFLQTLRQAQAQNLNVIGILAGPIANETDKRKVEAAQRELKTMLEYRGALYGADKDAFFEAIDVFIFPTRYKNEAQPTVIFEAMSRGIPILSYERGCIKGQIGGAGVVFDQNADFSAAVTFWLKAYLDDAEAFHKLRLKSRMAFLNDREDALKIAQNLFLLPTQTFDCSNRT